MTPKEHQIVKELLQRVAQEAYERGYKDGKEGAKPLEEKDFSMGRGSALILSTNLKKVLEKR